MRNILLFLSLVLCSIKAQAYIDGEKITIDKWDLTVVSAANLTVAVTGCTQTTAECVIPSTIFDGVDKTFTVVQVGGGKTANWSKNISSLTLPETVVTIAANFCFGLTVKTLNIPKSVKNITDASFKYVDITSFTVDADSPYFQAIDGVLYTKGESNLPETLVSLPKSLPLTNGEFHVVEGCKTISRVSIFSKSDLTTLYIPSTVNNIPVAKTVDQVDVSNNGNLASFIVAEGNATYASADGVLFNKDMSELIKYPRAKEATTYKIPDGVTTINSFAFHTVSAIKTLDLNDVSTLSENAIYNCNKLTSITVPAELTSLDGAISSCSRIAEYNVEEGNTVYCSDNGVIYSADKKTLVLYPIGKTDETYEIPPSFGVTEIGAYSFCGSGKIKKVVVPASVETIAGRAFYECGNLNVIEFADDSKLTKIDEYVFSECTSLSSINLPEGLTDICTYAFAESGLTEIRVPASVKSIGTTSFSNCKKLEKVTIADGSLLSNISNSSFSQCPLLKSFVFEGENSCSNIGANCFNGCTSLESFDIPNTVTNIGNAAFYNCSSMETVTFQETSIIESISTGAFADSGIKSIELPNSVKTVGKEAFRNCTELETISLSKNAQSVHTQSFLGCSNLTEINVDRDNLNYSSIDGILLSKDKKTLVIFPEGKANEHFTLLPPSLTKIGEEAFYNCKKLTNITIPNKVSEIGSRAFGLCSNLNTITFLCDEMISPDNIAQGINISAFDDGVVTADDNRKNININVRKEQIADYENEDFYKAFGSIEPSFIDGTEEFIVVSDNSVDLLHTAREDYTFVVPKSVKNDGKTYDVRMVGDYCFQNVTDAIKEVVVFNNIEYVGAKAFITDIDNNTSTVENIFFIEAVPSEDMLSTTRFLLDDTKEDYSEIAATTKVYVKKSALDKYKTVFGRYIDDAYDYSHTTKVRTATPDMFDYKIPGVNIKSTYGTFSREFDVDFGDVDDNGNMKWWDDAKDCPKVIAFTGFEKWNECSEDTRTVVMHSINEGADKSVDGLYVPANTGVLLKAVDGASPDGFYYRIGEDDKNSFEGDNVLKDVTVNSQEVIAKRGIQSSFYISNGTLKRVVGSVQMPVHKAYLMLDNVSSNAKVFLSFSDFDSYTTSVENVTLSKDSVMDNDNKYSYDMAGRQFDNLQRGIYIQDGKKFVKR